MKENHFDYYSSFTFYDHKRRRLSIFAKEVDDNHLEITVIPCSMKDMFSRKVGRKMYEDGESITDKVIVPIVDNLPKNTFIEYCRDNYLQLIKAVIESPVDLLATRQEKDEIYNSKPEDYLGEKQ